MKRWICVLLIVTLGFSGAAAGFTYGLIQKHRTPPAAEEVSPPPEEPQLFLGSGIDLYGTYDENDLIYTDELVLYKGVEITVPRISGLKDQTVEEKINTQIHHRIYAVLDAVEGVNYASGSLMANFGNVISLHYGVGTEEGYEQLRMNYNLVTGEPLHVTDLFYDDADLLTLVRESFYDTLALGEWNGGNAVSPDENRLYKVVKAFMEDDDPEFTFTAAAVNFYSGDLGASVDFIDIPNQVAIYERFDTENSIYLDDNVGFDNLFTCSNSIAYHSFRHIDFGLKDENFWYDVSMMGLWLPEGLGDEDKQLLQTLEDDLLKEIYREIDRYAGIAAANPDKFYILMAKPYYSVMERSVYVGDTWQHTVTNACQSAWNMELWELPMELYESEYQDKLIDAYRNAYFFMAGGAYLDRYQENDNGFVTTVNNQRLVNFRTGEELTLENLFREGADWIFYVRNEIIQRLTQGFYGDRIYTHPEAIQLAQTAEVYLDGANIRARIPAIPEFDLWYSVTEFPKEVITIYD